MGNANSSARKVSEQTGSDLVQHTIYSAVQVADYIIHEARKGEEVHDKLKILKLVYLAHGIHLAVFDRPLFFETVEAWKYGPVVRTVYDQMGRRESHKIKEPFANPEMPQLDKDAVFSISQTLRIYSKFDGLQLSSLTHKDGTPWKKSYRGANDVISNDLIKHYFKRLLGIER